MPEDTKAAVKTAEKPASADATTGKKEEKPASANATTGKSVSTPPSSKLRRTSKASTDKKEEKKQEKNEGKKEAKKVAVPAKFKDLVGTIEKMSVLELSELVKVLEDKFGVSAAVAATPAAGAVPAGGEGATEVEEKSEYNLELKDIGGQKIQVIKAVREITGKGLKDAKDLVDKAPGVIKEKVAKKEAEEAKKKLEEAGAKVELK